MRKLNWLIVILLIANLAFGVLIFLRTEDHKNALVGTVRFEQLERMENSFLELSQRLEQLIQEQKWLQKASFELDTEASDGETMVVVVELSLKRSVNEQAVFFLYREDGTSKWKEKKVSPQPAGTYTAEITLSPRLAYEYMVSAQGLTEAVSEVGRIPYNIYGLPKWKTDVRSEIDNKSRELIFNIQVYMPTRYPLPQMTPAGVDLTLKENGGPPEIIPLAAKQASGELAGMAVWSGKWVLVEPRLTGEIEASIEVTYQNGLKRTEKVEEIINRIKYEREKK